MDLVDGGAVAVRGNHDTAVGDPRQRLNVEAEIVIEWTRGELGAAERRFLAELPLTCEDEDRLYVHADASSPKSWRYVTDIDGAARSLIAIAVPHHILRPCSSSGALHHVGDGQDDGVHAGHRFRHSIAAEPALACRARLGRPAARRRSGRVLRHAGYRAGGADLLPRALRCRSGRRANQEQGLAALRSPTACALGNERWSNRTLESARRSTASASRNASIRAAWRRCGASRAPDAADAHADESAEYRRRRRPGSDRQLRDGTDDLAARLSGVHVPKFLAVGDFAVQPYIVMERIPGKSLFGGLPSCRCPMAKLPTSA